MTIVTDAARQPSPAEQGARALVPAEPAARGIRHSILAVAAGALRPGRGLAFSAFWLLIIAILVVPILLFLAVAFSPALLDQGPQWFTLSAFQQALNGQLLTAFINSTVIGVVTAVVGTAVAFWLAWVVQRTDLPGRRLWTGVVFALLLTPSYLIALGWMRLLEPNGVLQLLGVTATWPRDVMYGPVGIVVVLTVKGIPFAYLAISNALRGLGHEFEDAVRVHGGGPVARIRVVVALLSPGVWAALAIVFAESISDFGVASTLANDSHFLVATYSLYMAVDSFPVQFPVASAISWVLLVLIVLALIAQSRALRGRSFRVLSGRSRPARLEHVGPLRGAGLLLALVVFLAIALGVPAFGAVSASLIDGLGSLAGSHHWDFSNYRRVLTSPSLGHPLMYSAWLAAVTATVAIVLAVVCARMLATSGAKLSGRLLDFVLLAAVALPGIVFAAGYIFAYNLPFWGTLHVQLYGTTTLLAIAYLATALPSTTRVLMGTMSQVQESMIEASRVHGRTSGRAWLSIVIPLIARPLLSAWLLTYAATLLELPVSQLLSPAGKEPISVGIETALSKYDYGGGTAMQVLAIAFALIVVCVGFGAFRLFAPAGWRRIGRASR
ncbi:ABC transporter permease [Gryllotalpicola reticulitermitis]|uniref:ABC transporter permease n=1 Tax=Gryllotalpicola reticulitermitis TaxID=1184153 RepID=A0ABV8Q5P6_9MICO